MCSPLSAGVEFPIFKKGGLARSQFLDKVAGKEGMTFFSRGRICSFYMKNKQLKSEIFKRQKKSYERKCLSAITKNLNWQILTKNLVTFKR